MERLQLQRLDVLKLRNHIEQQVTSAVLNGALCLGDRLVKTAIAGSLGVSRAPVREALAALERISDGGLVKVRTVDALIQLMAPVTAARR